MAARGEKKTGAGGPHTTAGKARSSRNALSHGILSRDLLLPEEDPAEWQVLIEQLLVELDPVGTLEQILVERIAVAIWRQRRLVRVETARIQISQRPDTNHRKAIEAIIGADQRQTIAQVLNGVGEAGRRVIFEKIKSARSRAIEEMDVFRVEFPELWQLLLKNAKTDDGVQAYLHQNFQGSLDGFLVSLESLYNDILVAYEKARVQKSAFSLPAAPELMTRYQSALDNDLYKAMRALREAQRFRRESIDFTTQDVSVREG